MERKLIDPAELEEALGDAPLVAIDTETTVVDLNREVPDLVLMGISDGTRTWVVWLRDLTLALGDLLESRVSVFHNAAFDLAVLVRAGLLHRSRVRELIEAGVVHDTMILDQLLRLTVGEEGSGVYHGEYDGSLPRRSLRKLAEVYLGRKISKGPRMTFGDLLSPAELTTEQFEYACVDAETTYQIYQTLRLQLPKGENPWGPLSESIQIGASLALWEIGQRGLTLDVDRLDQFEREATEGRKEAAKVLRREELLETVRGKGKLSVKRLRTLFEDLATEHGLTIPRTETGKIGIAREDWDEHVDLHPAIDAFVRYRRWEKLLTAFIRNWRSAARDGVIRPRYRTLVATGRTASYGPNLQQVPRRRGSLREAFRARTGSALWEIDYHGIELVCVAQICWTRYGTSDLRELLNSGRDVHRFVAARIHRIPEDEVDEDQRFLAKMANFGFWGGMGPRSFVRHCWRLARLRIDETAARSIYLDWQEAFPEARRWIRDAEDAGTDPVPAIVNCRAATLPLFAGAGSVRRALRGEESPVAGEVFRRVLLERERFRLDWPIATSFRDDVAAGCGSPGLLDWLTWRETRTLTGRIRVPVGYSEWMNTQFQGLAADGAKLALLRLWERKAPVCAFIHDSILLETDDVMRVRDTAWCLIRNMRRLTPDVRVGVEIRGPMRNWGQEAPTTEIWSDR